MIDTVKTMPGTLRRLLGTALAVVLLAMCALASAPTGALAQQRDPAYEEFYPTLDEHGSWIAHPRYGDTWVPYTNDDPEWRPYTHGQWVYTEEHGWYWESDEPFGWIVYHYGRWLLDPYHKWMWVPGTEWGPAWVAWREGEEAVGWAPLPPEADLSPDGTLSTVEIYDQPRYAPMWIFVAPAMITAAAIYRYMHPPSRNAMYFGRTRHMTYYSRNGRSVFNRGLDPRFVEHHTRRPLPLMRVQPSRDPRNLRSRPDERQVRIYRPNLPQTTPGRPRPGFTGAPLPEQPRPRTPSSLPGGRTGGPMVPPSERFQGGTGGAPAGTGGPMLPRFERSPGDRGGARPGGTQPNGTQPGGTGGPAPFQRPAGRPDGSGGTPSTPPPFVRNGGQPPQGFGGGRPPQGMPGGSPQPQPRPQVQAPPSRPQPPSPPQPRPQVQSPQPQHQGRPAPQQGRVPHQGQGSGAEGGRR